MSIKWKKIWGTLKDFMFTKWRKVLFKKLNKFHVHEVKCVGSNFIFAKWKTLTTKLFEISCPRKGQCLFRKSVQTSYPQTGKV